MLDLQRQKPIMFFSTGLSSHISVGRAGASGRGQEEGDQVLTRPHLRKEREGRVRCATKLRSLKKKVIPLLVILIID